MYLILQLYFLLKLELEEQRIIVIVVMEWIMNNSRMISGAYRSLVVYTIE